LKFKHIESKIQTVKQGDPRWLLEDGLVIYPRAAIYIDENCPSRERSIIENCVRQGWIQPIAHVYGKELTWDALR
jgi:hypothetical protein